MVESSLKELTEYKVVGRRSPHRPQVPLRSTGISRHGQSSQSRPGQRDTVLATVKDATRRPWRWPKRAILDGVCARCHWARAGRDGETAIRSNKETDQTKKGGEDTEYNTDVLDNGPHTRVGKSPVGAETLAWSSMAILPTPSHRETGPRGQRARAGGARGIAERARCPPYDRSTQVTAPSGRAS